jgi:hypothetical protein
MCAHSFSFVITACIFLSLWKKAEVRGSFKRQHTHPNLLPMERRKKNSLSLSYRNRTFSKLPPIMGAGFRPIQSSRIVA